MLLVINLGVAQTSISEYEQFLSHTALDLVAFRDFESALSLYQQLDSIHPSQPQYVFNLGVCLFESQDKPQSLLYFLKAYTLGYHEPDIYLYMARAYHFNFDFDNAVFYFDKFISLVPDTDSKSLKLRDDAMRERDQIISSKDIFDRRLSVDIRNMGEALNSESADYVPLSSGSDDTIIFTSRRSSSKGGRIARDGYHFEDIYISRKDSSGNWSNAVPIPEFNSSRHDANVALNHAASEIYIFKARNNGDIFRSKKTKTGWDKPKKVKGINSRYWEGSICLSPTEDTIFFSSDRPGGYGGSDLYYATRSSEGKWRNITNLGADINTEEDEDSPYMHIDGKTLFFSSKGHNSIGGFDIFSAKLKQGEWTAIRNIGFPVNSIGDDIYFQLNADASSGYFTSFRYSNFSERSVGEKDLFEIVRPHSSPVYFIFKGRVFDGNTREPLPAIVTMTDLEDQSNPPRRLVVDINSGKFRYDLRFDHRYKVEVEIAGKLYFSRELFFPYQPDLFETFLDIPLNDIPVFKMKLNDILFEDQDTMRNMTLDAKHKSEIILVRRVPGNDKELKELLTSSRIPLSFRQKLRAQLNEKQFADSYEEGDLDSHLLGGIDSASTALSDPVYFGQKLDEPTVADVIGFSANEALKKKTESQTAQAYNQLTDLERKMVDRLSTGLLSDSLAQTDFVTDALYWENLSADERLKFLNIVGWKVRQDISFSVDGPNPSHIDDKLFSLNSRAERLMSTGPIPIYNTNAWGILYTIESAGMRSGGSEKVQFEGQVNFRSSGKTASKVNLVLTDDHGTVYSKQKTNDQGEVVFDNLKPGKRYHVLVDDYMIALSGRSRYEMMLVEMRSVEEDYQAFYNKLSLEEKRAVDRIIAVRTRNEIFGLDSLARLSSATVYERLSEHQRLMINTLKKYINSVSQQQDDFFLERQVAFKYDHSDVNERRNFNHFISEQIVLTSSDSNFYSHLTSIEKGFINKIGDLRKANNTLFDDFEISQRDADYWYILDEIDTDLGAQIKKVRLSAQLLFDGRKPSETYQVSLLDEHGEINYDATTDSAGRIYLSGIEARKKYKLLIRTGHNVGELAKHSVAGLKLESDDHALLQTLSSKERRMVDRIIAIRLASEDYTRIGATEDESAFDKLSLDETEFLARIRAHIFADSAHGDDLYLLRADNQMYYQYLSSEERNFVNRNIVRDYFRSVLHTDKITLRNEEKLFFDRLTANERLEIDALQRERRRAQDIIAENPVLIAEKTWTLLDSITVKVGTPDFKLSGQILKRADSTAAMGVNVMIVKENNEMIGVLSTDSSGSFNVSKPLRAGKYFILTQSSRNVFRSTSALFVSDLRAEFASENERDPLRVVVQFDFDAILLKPYELKKLLNLLTEAGQLSSLKEVVVKAHTDRIGSSVYNSALSFKRAQTIQRILINVGIPASLITVNGLGETELLFNGMNEYRNRRAEVIISR